MARVKLDKTRTRRFALPLILLCSGISILWGFSVGRTTSGGTLDFQAIYYGTRCLLEHHNPYKVSELENVYRTEAGDRPGESVQRHQVVTLFVNLPTTFVLVAPFAMLPWNTAQALWLILLTGVFILAACLMGKIGARDSPGVSLFLICILLANSELIFATGNTAGVAIGLCVVAVWCFLKERFVPAGILCLAISLAVKPHDAGLVWFYFLLAGGVYRKRALQSLLVTVILGLSAFLWVSHVAPHWIEDWQSNLTAISAHGGLNEPGPASVTGRTAGMVIDLQAAVSVFRNDPLIYNAVSYLVCGALLLVWSVHTLRSRFSQGRAWLALAAVVPLTMLVTYHRPYDAKLLLLTVPACALLWAEGGPIGWFALIVNTVGIVFTGDVPLAILVILTNNWHGSTAGIFGQILTVVLTRPAPLILLVMSIFYLWVYLRRAFAPATGAGGYKQERSASATV